MTAGLQFFRSIGSTAGLAAFERVLTTQFHQNMRGDLPAPLRRYAGNETLANPHVLPSDQAAQRIHALFAKYGTAGEKLFVQFTDAVRQSPDSALGDLLLQGAGVAPAGLVVVRFLREDPLRTTHLTREQQEMLIAEGGLEPDITCARRGRGGGRGGTRLLTPQAARAAHGPAAGGR